MSSGKMSTMKTKQGDEQQYSIAMPIYPIISPALARPRPFLRRYRPLDLALSDMAKNDAKNGADNPEHHESH